MAQRYPVNYYKVYPYSDNYPSDYYYPQDSYPMYYPPRTSKYEVYQAVLPYYYQEPYTRPSYNYGYEDPLIDLQDEVQEAEREEREEAQPIGHESFYENDDESSDRDGSYADINAAFLQNLILSQMYQDSLDNQKQSYDGYNDYDESYGRSDEVKPKTTYPAEDENVRELKQLPKQGKNRQLRKQKQRKQNQQKQQKEEKRSSDYLPDSYQGTMVYADRKPIMKLEPSSSTTEIPKNEVKGQKEEFQMRPATPVRHPFASPVLAMMTNTEKEKKRTPSVYDTIKHMLDMEKSLENVSGFVFHLNK